MAAHRSRGVFVARTARRAPAWAPLAVLVALAVLGGAQVAALFVWPPEPDSARRPFDAVVVLSGDHGDRFDLGWSMASHGAAPVLVILRPDDGPATRSRPLCGRSSPVEVLCPDPTTVSTAGDIAEVSRLARARGWRSVAIVTSRFHVVRTRVLVWRCAPGLRVDVFGSDPPFGVREWSRVVAHEVAGTAASVGFVRC